MKSFISGPLEYIDTSGLNCTELLIASVNCLTQSSIKVQTSVAACES